MGEQIKKGMALLIIHLFNCLPIRKNKLFFMSYYGSQYGCNPKYITEYILNHYPSDTFDIVWAFNEPDHMGRETGFRKVKVMSLRYFYDMCTAKVIITNFRTTDLFVKRKKQHYIQTWHSSLRLKQIEKDAENFLPENYVKMAKKDSRKCDVLLSGCQLSTDIFKRSFWFEGDIMETGTPRNDLFFHTDHQKKEDILKKLGIKAGEKVVLYAPTFRKDQGLDVYKFDYKKVLDELASKYGGSWKLLIKLHPHMRNKSKDLMFGKRVIDVTPYNDIQELLYISDVLISDYSSLMFDFTLTKRPCFLYVPDLNDYLTHERGLYFEIKKLPFIHAESSEELLEKIRKFEEEEYQNQIDHFTAATGTFEKGNACQQVTEHIKAVCGTEKERIQLEAI
ncbi:CDP-glycerol glycerophosphotransferase family protein [Salipaludibacillus sp. CUR1]|uniref:CDP-glycerol glycerophosphotransferase family protein n=1 Tax=Salipaludibacillus sp. CUR1 TaxID=2820003 RepID=UPI001E5AD175|nr:CDP-glycerol glycerophosphotransferase family protein [Salipaludibacillus sp. CUR1]MCE7792503.1 CDP-glycerol glycerophosphotransferase family protein [Salipaludibacillus sp. CUR1]